MVTASGNFGLASKWPKKKKEETSPWEFCHSRSFIGWGQEKLAIWKTKTCNLTYHARSPRRDVFLLAL